MMACPNHSSSDRRFYPPPCEPHTYGSVDEVTGEQPRKDSEFYVFEDHEAIEGPYAAGVTHTSLMHSL